jgi:hypothetical protein
LESLANGVEASVMGFNSYGVSMSTLKEICFAIHKRLLHLMGNMYILGVLKLGEEAELAELAEELSTKTATKKINNVKTK